MASITEVQPGAEYGLMGTDTLGSVDYPTIMSTSMLRSLNVPNLKALSSKMASGMRKM